MLSEAIAEEFQASGNAPVSPSGSRAPAAGSRSSAAVRPTSATRRAQSVLERWRACTKAGISFFELPIAYDGIAIVVNPKASWINDITVAELKKLWAPEAQGKVTRWSQVRAGWPDREIHLFGAGVDSGTYDYFTEAINGKEGASRGDFTSSEDDNVLVQGVAGDELALGFLPFAYFNENKTRLKLIPVDNKKPDDGDGPIAPNFDTIRNGTYQPLARPLFIYVSEKSLARPEVQQFVDFYLANVGKLAEEVGYVATRR